MNEIFERTINLIGEDNFKKITSKKVIVFGVGGVGGYLTEMLVRSGIQNLCLVDFDKVNISNLNRQIIALNSTIGQNKVDAYKTRILDINININLEIKNERVTIDNLESFNLKSYDYVIDCIDSFNDKLALIEYCYNNKINIISSMGAGNRYKFIKYDILDIYQTKNDALARKLRTELKKRNIKSLKVCCTDSISDNKNEKSKIFSMSYNVALCGITLASHIINDIIKK